MQDTHITFENINKILHALKVKNIYTNNAPRYFLRKRMVIKGMDS